MKLIKLHSLSIGQKKAVDELVAVCLKFDKLKRTLYLENDLNFYENLDSFYLLYEKGRLISVLTILEPYMDTAEISAYTLPEYRRKGCFTKLFYRAADELEGYEISHVQFVIEPESKSGISTARAFEAAYERSDYLLQLKINTVTEGWKRHQKEEILTNQSKGWVLRAIKEEESFEAVKLHQNIFKNSMEEAEHIIRSGLDSENMECYGFFIGNKLKGLCSLSFHSETASIFGLGITLSERGKGYGNALLYQVIKQAEEKGKKSITLEVASESIEAFAMYRNCGFEIATQYDYYTCALDNI
ncbi:acetyltransferase [Anaerocolumna cellulosilytica]|uniref:Acetyltransferase n=1 Tax=Anaerocolumna cellulosilytica TaxID=433286 RepID=A0A6S6R5N7_9FIRM|nr:GNAT family N-acetyltransferase [Anaerocolumna cellulosilytica]MBB5194036.1 ribosomal protein S18 acetylase RimI-like enzyme [Anaerocolumna cellulosilytica]BCJ94750.1 acetyltransferase [Anaerocolumna cellulosilytica]